MTDAPTQTIRLERVLPHPAERVFDAWLDPRALASFLKPAPGTTVHELVLRAEEGGGFSFVLHVGEARVPIRGTYGAIEPHTRLVFSWISTAAGDHSSVELELTALAPESTRLVLLHRALPTPASVQDHTHGWGRILDALEARLRAVDGAVG